MDHRQAPHRNPADPAASSEDGGERRRPAGRRAEDLARLGSGEPHRWTLRDVYRAAFRFRTRAVVFFVGVLALVSAGLILCPRKYRSEAQLFVRLGRENMALDPTVTAGTSGTVVGLNVTRDAEINSIIEVMGSRAIANQVAEQVGLDEAAENELQRDEAITRLMKSIAIASPKNTAVISVSCSARSPQRAQTVVQTLVETYLREHLRLNSTAGSREFFDQQAKLLKQQLDDAAAALRDAKSRFNLASLEGRRDALQRQVAEIETQALANESALAASEAKIRELRTVMGKLPDATLRDLATPHTNSTASTLRQKLFDLEGREKELLSRFTELHPTVVAIHTELEELRRILRAEQPDRDQATSAAILQEEADHQSLLARKQTIQVQTERLKQEMNQLNQQELQVTELERRVKVAETNYLAYMSSVEQTRVDEALKKHAISNINVIQPASLMLKPVSPKIGLSLTIALVVAGIGAVALALLSELLDHSLKTPEDVEKYLGLPLLVSVPRVAAARVLKAAT
jgi:uncharacterized protein involved in exopolysaccharide biosynthesis